MAASIGHIGSLCCFRRRGGYSVRGEIPTVQGDSALDDAATVVTRCGLSPSIPQDIDPERLCIAVCRDKPNYLEDYVADPEILREYRLYISDDRPTHVMTLAIICASPNILKFLLQRSRYAQLS